MSPAPPKATQSPTPEKNPHLVKKTQRMQRRLFRANRSQTNPSKTQKPKAKAVWVMALGVPLLAIAYGGWRLKPYFALFTEEIPVSALAHFANGNPLNGNLAIYNSIPQVQALRPLLQAPIYGDPTVVPALVDSAEGDVLLERLSTLIQTHDRQSDPKVLREALLTAAAQEDLSLLNVLRQFPRATIRINGQEVWHLGVALARSLYQNRTAVHQLQNQFDRQRLGTPLPPQSALLHPGERIDGFTVLLQDESRQRPLLLDVYQPFEPSETAAPVILISHGLTANRRTFGYLARYLASQGFFVAAIEHPDSNGEAHRNFLAGESQALLSPQTLIDRPLDIRYVLDRLEEINGDEWLDLSQVGLIGHSLGGNTVLTVAGAQLDREQLREHCDRANRSVNLSVIFAQCPMLKLPASSFQQNLQDDRIGAVVAMSPVASQIFDPSSLKQLDLPLLMVASEQDWITPAVEEQLQPFAQMQETKYLALLQGGAHWTLMGGRRCLVAGPRMQPKPDMLEQWTLGAMADPVRRSQVNQLHQQETRAIARDYLCGLSTAFFKTHLEDEPWQDYLSADYAASVSQPKLPLILVESLGR